MTVQIQTIQIPTIQILVKYLRDHISKSNTYLKKIRTMIQLISTSHFFLFVK